MERQRRQAQPSDENPLWGNPCDYSDQADLPKGDQKSLAFKSSKQASNAYESAAKYKDEFALKLHSYPDFDELLKLVDADEWLRNFSGFGSVLPKDKLIFQKMPDEYMNSLMTRIDSQLPLMHKALKMVVAGLDLFANVGMNDSVAVMDVSLKSNITKSMHDVRAVLCYFSDLLHSRSLKALPLPNSEVPDFTDGNRWANGLLLYRDTLNYLEYLIQVFQKLADTQ